jgi:hypothetical protein
MQRHIIKAGTLKYYQPILIVFIMQEKLMNTERGKNMSGQYYQPPQEQQPYPQQYPQQANKGIETHFIAKEKIGLFILLSIGMIFIGFLLLDLIASRLVDYEEAILFLGMLAVDAGILFLVGLLMTSGICREDYPEKTRNWIILVAGIILVFFLIIYMTRSSFF